MRLDAALLWRVRCRSEGCASAGDDGHRYPQGVVRRHSSGCLSTGKGTDADNERLTKAALEAARDVLSFVDHATPEQLKAVNPNIPMLWADAVGPSVDFQIGRLFQSVHQNQLDNAIMKRDIDPDWARVQPDVWDRRRASLWTEGHCQYLSLADQ